MKKAIANVALLPMKVRVGYDLRVPQAGKADDADLFHGWTVFLNARGTLAHVMRDGRPWMLIRIPGLQLKGARDRYIIEVMRRRLYEGIC